MNQRIGCLTPLALISAVITLAILVFAEITSGNSMFSPGALHADHASLGKDCAQCHAPFWSPRHMADLCLDCHLEIKRDLGDSASLHGILFHDRFIPCQDCHTEHAGPEAFLTVMEAASFPHDATGFALNGHQTRSPGLPFTCSDCHTANISIFDQQTCVECHRSLDTAYTVAHSLEFGPHCLACHDGLDRYGEFDHSQVKFVLTGSHLRVACSGCHLNARTLADLQNTPVACQACHQNDDAHAGRFGLECGVCHAPDAWKPAKFDHRLAAFQLDGKHVNVECKNCHTQGYAGTPTDCYSCHKQADPHNGQYGSACQTCHHPGDWKDATFDHSLSAFPLEGAHVNVKCAACHKNEIFKGTSRECAACHKEPAYHAGLFPGQPCSACHNTTAWKPARYDGPHTFPMNHGEKNNTCADCHQPNLTQWTCYSCHNQAETAAEHRDEGISNFDDCLRCHPTGQEGEGEDNKGDD